MEPAATSMGMSKWIHTKKHVHRLDVHASKIIAGMRRSTVWFQLKSLRR
jgi:hypothetical protein